MAETSDNPLCATRAFRVHRPTSHVCAEARPVSFAHLLSVAQRWGGHLAGRGVVRDGGAHEPGGEPPGRPAAEGAPPVARLATREKFSLTGSSYDAATCVVVCPL